MPPRRWRPAPPLARSSSRCAESRTALPQRLEHRRLPVISRFIGDSTLPTPTPSHAETTWLANGPINPTRREPYLRRAFRRTPAQPQLNSWIHSLGFFRSWLFTPAKQLFRR